MRLRSEAARRISRGVGYGLARPGVGMCHNHAMKFRTGLIIGFGVGYVFGTRAGRERYDQLKAIVDRVAANEQVRKAAAAAAKSTEGARNLTGRGLVAAGGAMREAAAATSERSEPSDGNGSGDDATEPVGTRRWQTPRYQEVKPEPTAAR